MQQNMLEVVPQMPHEVVPQMPHDHKVQPDQALTSFLTGVVSQMPHDRKVQPDQALTSFLTEVVPHMPHDRKVQPDQVLFLHSDYMIRMSEILTKQNHQKLSHF